MVELIAGRYGPKLLGPGSILNLDAKDEQRLVDRKVAVYIDRNTSSEESTKTHVSNDKLPLKTIADIKKIKSKKELVMYANSIGLQSINEALKKEDIINTIINYQEEKFGEER